MIVLDQNMLCLIKFYKVNKVVIVQWWSFLSNGFKIRSNTNEVNLNAHTYIYAAWAEAPSVDLYGGGANAR